MNPRVCWIVLACLIAAGTANAVTIKLSCGAVGQELALCRAGAEAWSRKTGHAVTVVPTPASATERLMLYIRVLQGRSDAIDVLQLDVVWPGLLEPRLLDLKPHSRGVEADHYGGDVQPDLVAAVCRPRDADGPHAGGGAALDAALLRIGRNGRWERVRTRNRASAAPGRTPGRCVAPGAGCTPRGTGACRSCTPTSRTRPANRRSLFRVAETPW